MARRHAPDNAEIARMEAAAAEAEDVLRTADHETYAKAAGLRSAVSAGLAPPASFVRDLRAALQRELEKAGESEPTREIGIDSGTTRATRVTMRGVLKRFEEAFGTGKKSGGER